MLNIGPQELLIILVIALVVVGPQRLPALGRSIGRGLREMRRAQDEVKRTIQVSLDEEEPSGTQRAPSARRPPAVAKAATEPSAAEDAPPTRVRREPTPSASPSPPASEIREVTRTLGRSLAELRRAREEVQRSFRVDLSEAPADPADKGGPRDPSPDGSG